MTSQSRGAELAAKVVHSRRTGGTTMTARNAPQFPQTQPRG